MKQAFFNKRIYLSVRHFIAEWLLWPVLRALSAISFLSFSDLQAEPRLVSMRWKEVASTLQDTEAAQIADTGEYRLRVSRPFSGTTVRRYVVFNELMRVNSAEGQSISMVSAALNLYNVSRSGRLPSSFFASQSHLRIFTQSFMSIQGCSTRSLAKSLTQARGERRRANARYSLYSGRDFALSRAIMCSASAASVTGIRLVAT